MQLSVNDRRLLNLIQTEFPLVKEPFAALSRHLNTSFDEVVQSISRLKHAGIIRLIGPVIDYRKLDFKSTLVAMKVADINLWKAEQVIADHPGISHGYEREHPFNIWLTLVLPQAGDIEIELQKLAQSTGAESAFSLPAIKVFKIGAYFDMEENRQISSAAHPQDIVVHRLVLSNVDRRILNELQQDISLVPEPFSLMAERAGVDTKQFLAGCRSLQKRGIIRRFSASINHRNAGFIANAMSCWIADPDRLDTAGRKLTSLKDVSHCYERKTNQYWPYNLFAMIHGRSREQCKNVVEKVSSETDLTEYVMLYSVKEIKKTRTKYLV